jgi:hypothetical protein
LYLRGFGPASINGMQTWSGLTGLRPIVEAMEADWELAKLEGPDGEELFDIEGLTLADEAADAPPRLVAPFDNIVLAQGNDRRRVIDDNHFKATATPNGRMPGFVLIDGRVAGIWNPRKDGKRTTVELEYLVDVSAADKRGVEQEREQLVEFCNS